MIKELINFTENLDEDIFSWNKKPSTGLHVFLNIDIQRDFVDQSFFHYTKTKSKEKDSNALLLEKIINYENSGRRIGTNMNKSFHKKLFACNPFIISFKKKNLGEITIDDLNDFLMAAQTVAKLSEHEIETANLFIHEVYRIMKNDIKVFKETTIIEDSKKGSYKKEVNLITQLGKEDYVNFYLQNFPDENGNVRATDFKKYHNRYLMQKSFNKDEAEFKIGMINQYNQSEYIFHHQLFKKEKDKAGKETKNYSTEFVDEYAASVLKRNYGISDYLNGLNSKKPYLEHKTAMFKNGVSQYIDGDMANALFKFEQLLSVNRILPNPLPIIIWKDKQKDSIIGEDIFLKEYKNNISIIKDKEIRIGFTEILKNIFEQNNSFRLTNFYLFNFAGGKLRDFDFVSEFKYRIDNLAIAFIFRDGKDGLNKKEIKNVFDFEREIVNKLFDNGLVTEYKLEQTVNKEKIEYKGVLFKYFDDLKDSNFKGNMFLLVTKYRKPFYDYIYKSKHEALNANIIEEILRVGLVDDVLSDKYNSGKHTNKFKIYNKLNIWFSLYDFFNNTINKKDTMASKIDQFRVDLIKIIKDERSLENGEDELFAYVAGQVVRYIQSKSRSADKSYARLEPFLNKTGAKEFKQVLKEEFEKYKHERYSNEFNNPFAQVNLYPLSQNMKDLLPFFLGGFFSKNLLFPGAINDN